MPDTDGYDLTWSYGVLSEMNTEPFTPETSKRYLTVYRIGWVRGSLAYPLHERVTFIDARPAAPGGVTLEAALQGAERILDAFDKPALIKAEWQRFFDHSKIRLR